MELTNEKTFLDLFKALIRYVASGFIFIIVFAYFRHDTSIWGFTTNNTNWTLILVAIICGILIYSVHTSFLDDIFYRISLWWLVRHQKGREFYLPNEFKKFVLIKGKHQQMPMSKIMFNLTTYRYVREGERTEEMKALQNRIDHLLALLVFLYTSSYSLVFLPVLFSIKYVHPSNTSLLTWDKQYWLVEILGIFLLLSGFRLDLKITKRELFIILKLEEKTNTAANKSIAASGADTSQHQQ